MVEKVGYSIEDAMQATGLGRTTIFELLRTGQLESIKVGRRRIIPADAIRAYFAAERARQAASGGGQAA
ncbi:helix-turn-helix domain-containing protein [Amycolatopsis dongchuanensis]|uniref:Helix-turn-helix domain-containing protein n=1 Tax=Amycolatopsis dongchuanensis TaxID=1070866 RepID=A0ABP8VHE2_9PSEU